MRWMDNIKYDMNKCGLEEGDAHDTKEKMEEDGTEPRPGIIAGQGTRMDKNNVLFPVTIYMCVSGVVGSILSRCAGTITIPPLVVL